MNKILKSISILSLVFTLAACNKTDEKMSEEEKHAWAIENGYLIGDGLDSWAIENGYVKFENINLEEWADNNGYVKDDTLDKWADDNGYLKDTSDLNDWAVENGYIKGNTALNKWALSNGYLKSKADLEEWAIANGYVKGVKDAIVNQNGSGNTQAYAHIIYFNHIDGIGNFDNKNTEAGKLPAIVMFEGEAITDEYMGFIEEKSEQHIKYQVSYLSANCRSSYYNSWSTIYVEMSATKSDLANPDNARITKIAYEGEAFKDDFESSVSAGHWGDSDVIAGNVNPFASANAKEKGVHGTTKQDFYDEIIPLLTKNTFIPGSTKQGLNKATLRSWMTESFNEEGFFDHEMIDLFENTKVDRYTTTLSGMEVIGYSTTTSKVSINDAYAGASVSLDNMLSILDALFDYHTTKLQEISENSKYDRFYEYEDDGFKGVYVVESADSQKTTVISKTELEAMKEDGETYLVFSSSEGCSSCAAFSKAVNSYVKQTGQKVYEILHAQAKQVFPSSLISSLYAPQLFLMSDGEIVAVMNQQYIDNTISMGSYKIIYKNFTKALLSGETR